MGLFGFLGGTRTKADIDREIARLQGDVERLKASIASSKAWAREKAPSGVRRHYNPSQDLYTLGNLKARIASLKAERKNAPK